MALAVIVNRPPCPPVLLVASILYPGSSFSIFRAFKVFVGCDMSKLSLIVAVSLQVKAPFIIVSCKVSLPCAVGYSK